MVAGEMFEGELPCVRDDAEADFARGVALSLSSRLIDPCLPSSSATEVTDPVLALLLLDELSSSSFNNPLNPPDSPPDDDL
jgi:hypothetical protein